MAFKIYSIINKEFIENRQGVNMKTYYIKQKISLNDKYYVYDATNEPYLEIISNNKVLTDIDRVLGGIFTFGNKLYIKSLDGKELLTIKKKFGFFKQEYDFYTGEKIIASFKQHILSMTPKISIISNNNQYLVKGDLMAKSFNFYKNNINIAVVKKVIFSINDSYKINILNDEDEIICLAILIAIDNSIHN